MMKNNLTLLHCDVSFSVVLHWSYHVFGIVMISRRCCHAQLVVSSTGTFYSDGKIAPSQGSCDDAVFGETAQP